jgi:hypothetical protein
LPTTNWPPHVTAVVVPKTAPIADDRFTPSPTTYPPIHSPNFD